MSSKATCKEQCTKCKCIVQEREFKGGNKKNGNGNACNVSNGSNGNSSGCNGNKVHCVEAYRDLGECLQKAIMAASQTKKEDDYSC